MKTTPSSVRPSRRTGRSGLAVLAAIFVVTSPVLFAKKKPAPIKNEPPADNKPFVLYQGADIDLQVEDDIHRVKSIVGNAFVVAVNNEPVEVAITAREKVKMKVVPQMKLTNKTAVVKGLKFERAYTPENDPNKKFYKEQPGSAAQSYAASTAGLMASAMMGDQLTKIRWGNGGGGGGGGSGPSGGLTGSSPGTGNSSADVLMQFINNYNYANYQQGIDLNSAGYAGQQLQEELDKELFDAVEVTFEVSSPKPMLDPYLLIVAEYKVKDEPGVVKNWIYAKQLERLDEHPLKVRFKQGGLTPGFELVKQELHIYGSGRELGTNVADQRQGFTRDEAHRYMVTSYLSAQKTATLAPTIVLGVSRKDLMAHYPSVQLPQAIFVKVDKDGLPKGVFRDEACAEAMADPQLESFVTQARFRPALAAGKPVEGVAKLQIGDLAI